MIIDTLPTPPMLRITPLASPEGVYWGDMFILLSAAVGSLPLTPEGEMFIRRRWVEQLRLTRLRQ